MNCVTQRANEIRTFFNFSLKLYTAMQVFALTLHFLHEFSFFWQEHFPFHLDLKTCNYLHRSSLININIVLVKPIQAHRFSLQV